MTAVLASSSSQVYISGNKHICFTVAAHKLASSSLANKHCDLWLSPAIHVILCKAALWFCLFITVIKEAKGEKGGNLRNYNKVFLQITAELIGKFSSYLHKVKLFSTFTYSLFHITGHAGAAFEKLFPHIPLNMNSSFVVFTQRKTVKRLEDYWYVNRWVNIFCRSIQSPLSLSASQY